MVQVIGLDVAEQFAVTRYQPFRVTVEDWRGRETGDRPAGTWTFIVQAVDVPGAVTAAKRHLSRRTTDRIVAVVADEGGR